jgi:hypothetical protein
MKKDIFGINFGINFYAYVCAKKSSIIYAKKWRNYSKRRFIGLSPGLKEKTNISIAKAIIT